MTGDSMIPIENSKTNDVKIDGESDPDRIWNLNLKVEHTLPQPTPNQTSQDSQQLIVKLFRKRSVGPTSYIGQVKICVTTLLNKWDESQNESQNFDEMSYDVEGTPNGKLKISYSFGDTNQEQPTHI